MVGSNAPTSPTIGRNFFSPRETTIKRGQFADNLSLFAGRHNLKFGGDINFDRILNFFPGNFSGVYTFNSLENFGRSLAGVPLTSAAPGASGDRLIEAFAGPGTSGPTTHPNIFELSWFVQDDWRVNNHLTLNLGLRHDLQKTARPPVANPAAAAAGIQTDRLNTDTNNFGPRLGVAWTPRSASKLVVSGGYGLFYGRTPSIMVGTAHSNNGLSRRGDTFLSRQHLRSARRPPELPRSRHWTIIAADDLRYAAQLPGARRPAGEPGR